MSMTKWANDGYLSQDNAAGGWRLGVKNILRLLHPDKEISYLTKICKMKIDVCDSWSIQKSCQHDGMIMTIFNNIGISGYKQFNLYASRIYLQVTTLSDNEPADGTGICTEILDCTRIPNRYSKWKWPQQPERTDTQKEDWKEAILKYLVTQGSKKLLQLKQRLGIWFSKSSME